MYCRSHWFSSVIALMLVFSYRTPLDNLGFPSVSYWCSRSLRLCDKDFTSKELTEIAPHDWTITRIPTVAPSKRFATCFGVNG